MKKAKVYSPRHRRETGARTFESKPYYELYVSGDWQTYRLRYLSINSRCYSCGDRSGVVDHLEPHQGDVKLFEKLDNHIPLCKRCHDRVTALFDKKHRKGNSIEPKIKWLKFNRQAKGLTFKVKVLPNYR